jgi:outer membrane biosynthesis protein TonB
METARSVFSAIILSAIVVFVVGCTSPRTVGEPQGETASPPVVDAAPTEPPPGYVKPENYWVREKIVLKSEPAPPATEKAVVKQGKKTKQNKKASASAKASPTKVTPN